MSKKQPVLNYYELSSDVTAFSTTRHGGVSDGNYASLNINEYWAIARTIPTPTDNCSPPNLT